MFFIEIRQLCYIELYKIGQKKYFLNVGFRETAQY